MSASIGTTITCSIPQTTLVAVRSTSKRPIGHVERVARRQAGFSRVRVNTTSSGHVFISGTRNHCGCLLASPNLFGPHILEKGKIAAIFLQSTQIKLGADDAFAAFGVGKDLAVLVDDDAAAGVVELGIATDSIAAGHVALILNRPRLEQFDP